MSDAIAGTTNGGLMINVRWPDMRNEAGLGLKVQHVLTAVGMDAGQYGSSSRPLAGAVALAEDSGGQVVGIVHARFNLESYNDRFGELEGLPRPQCMLDKIAVLPTARRSGVGKLLMRATATEAQHYGCTHIALMVDWSSESAGRVQFFKECGLWSLVPGRDDDLFGADLETVLRSTA